MQRHLEAWGVTFEQLLQDLRLHHALIGLREQGRTVTDVAFELGYSDAAHFSRAFLRWTGQNPSDVGSSLPTIHPTIMPLLTGAP
jgi:AraC-like DNA-binding protein